MFLVEALVKLQTLSTILRRPDMESQKRSGASARPIIRFGGWTIPNTFLATCTTQKNIRNLRVTSFNLTLWGVNSRSQAQQDAQDASAGDERGGPKRNSVMASTKRSRANP